MEKIEKILTKIIKIIFNIIIAILLVITIILMINVIQISLLNKPYTNLFGYSAFEVQTGSMSGTLEVGDIIIVKLTKEVGKDDIITYESEGELITHRIIQIDDEGIITKGDANNTEDEMITKEKVIGKVVFHFANITAWKKVLTTPKIYILIIITLTLFGISISIKEENPEKEGNQEKKEEKQE